MIKQKKCKAIGKAFGFESCGTLTNVERLKYGLCPSCYPNFILNDERGKIIMQKAMNLGKQKVSKENKKIEKDKALKSKIELISPDKYRSEYLQPIINEISRLIDFGQPCIATGNYGKMNGGHYIGVGANRTTALNLHNIHIQSFESNHHKSGDPIKYRLGLIEWYGNKYFEFVEYLQRHKPLKLTKAEMIEIALRASSIRNDLRRNEETKTAYERIELRNEINLKLGIYDHEFCEFSGL